MDSVVPVNKRSYKIPEVLPEGYFRTYDIRGAVAEDGLHEDVAYAIGRAVAAMARERGIRDIIVGRDGRLSGPVLKAALIAGLLASGCHVIDIGVVSTPMLYFATHRLSTNTGIMVTASHNPRDHNGFKVVLDGTTLSTEGVQEILQRIKSRSFVEGEGSTETVDVVDDYVEYIKQHVKLKRRLKVVVDCGNGAASLVAAQLYRDMGCDVVELYCELDGNFPHHHPDPSVPENLTDIIAKVKEVQADLGLAFDGDADRIGLVTNKGDIIWPDRQTMLFACDVLKRYPGADIVFDVKCTNNLAKVVKDHGGNPVMYRTGHSLLKGKMIELGAPLAGEMSGHIFFKDQWFGFDDGVYVGARLLQILAAQNRALSDLFDELPSSVNTPEIKMPMPEDKKSDFMHRLMTKVDFEKVAKKFGFDPAAIQKITIDGLRIDFGRAWGLVRPSNTSPYLTIRFEADTQHDLDQVMALFQEVFSELGVSE